jgi:glycosyltransferase involved in cell wall biosynthesis
VDILNAHGFTARLAHREHGFRCKWFENQTAVAYPPDIWPPKTGDILVVPEILAWEVLYRAPGVAKVIFNQNPYETFMGRTDPAMAVPYTHPDVIASIVVSEDSQEFLRYAFPAHAVHRLHNAVSSELFHPNTPKKKQIAYMPRKLASDAKLVVELLKCRGVLREYSVVPIENRNEAETAAILRESEIFLSFSMQEGSPMPPLEAMASGCITIGYDGLGGREYLREPFGIPVPQEDVVALAKAIEKVVEQLNVNPMPLRQMTQAAATMVSEQFSPQREETDVVSAWNAILGQSKLG